MAKIQIKRGLKSDLPSLNDGEFGYCIDTKELFIGTSTGNVLVNSSSSGIAYQSSVLPGRTYNLADVVYNSVPTPGAPIGWVCCVDGLTCNIEWKTATAYSVGTQVYASGKVYECKVSGTSSTIPTGTGANITDGTITWKYVNKLAVFYGFGMISSAPVDITPPVVTVSPVEGTYTSTQLVTLATDEVATIYYTLDGSNPTQNDTVYSSPISLNSNKTLKYFAVDSSGNKSVIKTAVYVISIDTTAPIVTPSILTGTYTSTQSVTLSVNESATIYYTLDGSTPTTSSTVYTAPISITNTTTLKYFAKDLANNISSVQTQTYTIDTTPPVITINPAAGIYNSTKLVTLSANETATIYYTTDGSTPTQSSTVYSTPLSISATTTLKYFGKDTAGNISNTQTALFTIDTVAPDPVTSLTSGTILSTSVVINWVLSGSSDVANYEVAYSTDGSNYTVASSLINSSVTSYTVNGLNMSTTYIIRVIAIDNAGNRSNPTTVNATTAAGSSAPVVQSDSFDRANSTSTLGSASVVTNGFGSWTVYGATYGISSNQGYKVSAQTGSVAVVESYATDATVSLKFAVNTVNSKLVFRFVGYSSYLAVVNNTTNYLIIKRNLGTTTTLGTINVTPANGDVISVALSGSSITAKINGANSTTVTETLNMNESMYGFGLDDNTARVDDFVVNGYGDVAGPYVNGATTTSLNLISTAVPGATSYEFYMNDVLSTTKASPANTFSGLTAATAYQFKVVAVHSGGKSAGRRAYGSTLPASVSTAAVSDSFNRADSDSLGITDSGHYWYISSYVTNPSFTTGNSISIRNNSFVNRNGSASYPMVTTNGKSDNIKISFDAITYNPVGFPNMEIIFRLTDNNNYWVFGRSNGSTYLSKNASSVKTSLASYAYNYNGTALPHNYSVELRGSRILCYINGILMFDYTDTFNQSGQYHGASIYFQDLTALDNFSITDIVSAAPPAHTAPSEVTNVVATPQANGTSIVMTWTGSANAYTYDVYVNGTLKTTVLQGQTASVNANYTITGLTSATSYSIKILARDGSGNSTTGVTVNSTTL